MFKLLRIMLISFVLSIPQIAQAVQQTPIEGESFGQHFADFNANFGELYPTLQVASLADGGLLTPTVSKYNVLVALTCTANPSAIVMTEGGSEVDMSTVTVVNVGTNACTFADNAGVVELSSSITLNQYETLTLQYRSDRWVMVSAAVNTLTVSSINMESGTINGGLLVSSQTVATYVMGSASSDSWGTYFINSDNDVIAFTMESAVSGMAFCIENGQGVNAAITLTPAAGDYLVSSGVRGTIATARFSTGALGDKICVVCIDATDCNITNEVGTWSE